jgi:hypothetical protein
LGKAVLIVLIVLAGGFFQISHSEKMTSGNLHFDVTEIVEYQNNITLAPLVFNMVSQSPESLTIPLKRAGNLILIEAVVDSVPGNLILDTGSTGMVLNSIYFRKGRKTRGLTAGGITGSTGTVSRIKILNMQISELLFEDITADAMDLGHIENARNIKVLGFFGLNLIADYESVMDLRSGVLELYRLDNSGNRTLKSNEESALDIIIPSRTFGGVMFFDAFITGRKITLCLDSGAESNVLSIHLPDKVLSTVDIFRRSTLRGAGTQQVEVLYGAMNDISIGNFKILGMNTIITNLSSMGEAYAVRIDGMLGCDFLEKGVFYMNLRQSTVGIRFYEEELK